MSKLNFLLQMFFIGGSACHSDNANWEAMSASSISVENCAKWPQTAVPNSGRDALTTQLFVVVSQLHSLSGFEVAQSVPIHL